MLLARYKSARRARAGALGSDQRPGAARAARGCRQPHADQCRGRRQVRQGRCSRIRLVQSGRGQCARSGSGRSGAGVHRGAAARRQGVVGARGREGRAPAHGLGNVVSLVRTDHADAFARNGAAEVLQNVGILDSLVVLEAATMRPSPARSSCSGRSPPPAARGWPVLCSTAWTPPAVRACVTCSPHSVSSSRGWRDARTTSWSGRSRAGWLPARVVRDRGPACTHARNCPNRESQARAVPRAVQIK